MHGKKVLIIDDDTTITSTLYRLFAEAGAKVRVASSYEAAMEALKLERPDVAIVDLLLSDHSGLDVINETRKLSGTQPFFVILTNSLNDKSVTEAMDANVTMFVQKADHDPSEIIEMIEERMRS